MARIKNWTKLKAEGLWLVWRERFDSDEEAVATAVWIANRLIKNSRSRETYYKFYSIKDAWLVRQNAIGRKVRFETQVCRRCDGSGYDEEDKWTCSRCGGSGNYQERWLYLHEFCVKGQRYRFHSYQEPKILLDEMGKDEEVYGGRFADNELAELALPMSGLIRMLGYVAAAIWGLHFNGMRYIKLATSCSTSPVPKQQGFDLRHYWVSGG